MSSVAARPSNYRRLFRNALVAALLAAAVNALIFFVGAALGAFPQDVFVPRTGEPFSVLPFVIFTAVSVLAGVLVFALLTRIVARPKRVFWVLAAAVFTLMFFTPFTVPGAPVAMIVALELTHVVAAAGAVWAVARS